MTDVSATIAPKSDQLNADNLLAGPKTVRITKVTACAGSAEQPIAVYFEGDDNKPYKPCKSMRRVLVHVWGKDGSAYVGKSMTLYCDPNVQFGGIAVGGIRISHMSDIDAPVTMALTATRASRRPYTVKPLKVAPSETVTTTEKIEKEEPPSIMDRIAKVRTAIATATKEEQLRARWERAADLRSELTNIEPAAAHALTAEYTAKLKELSKGE